MRIRYNWNNIAFDSEGRHATGREVLTLSASGTNWTWMPEYEGDSTCDLPETDPDADPEDWEE